MILTSICIASGLAATYAGSMRLWFAPHIGVLVQVPWFISGAVSGNVELMFMGMVNTLIFSRGVYFHSKKTNSECVRRAKILRRKMKNWKRLNRKIIKHT